MSLLWQALSKREATEEETFGSLETLCLGKTVARAACEEARTEYSLDSEKSG